MNVYASVALSGDGYMDDRSPRRLILSTPADWREVMRLRAWADAILVGAETVRRDDPSLTVRDEALRRERLAANRPADPAKVPPRRTSSPQARVHGSSSPTTLPHRRSKQRPKSSVSPTFRRRGSSPNWKSGASNGCSSREARAHSAFFLRRGSSTRSAWPSIPPSASATRTPPVSNRLSIRHASRSSADGWKEWR